MERLLLPRHFQEYGQILTQKKGRGISIKLGYADTAFYKQRKVYYPLGQRPDGGKDVDSELKELFHL